MSALAPRRRFTEHKEGRRHVVLKADHPAVVNGATMFPGRVIWPGFPDRLLKSGQHSRKIGSHVVKGTWAGMPIYTLTLEERATCPRTCRHWLDCYGNKMNWSERLIAGPALEWRLGREVRALATQHPAGFVVRLHVLGDFYSVGYVRRWLAWLRRFPALRVYGYTARDPRRSAIGRLIAQAASREWNRFAVRFSNHGGDGIASTLSVRDDGLPVAGIPCPAQTGRTACCGTCALCWATRKPIAFKVH